ncbi:MBL fold metallo-hydrolase [Alkalibacter rhizosphaerae]|uniref:MBL fold metallo-hydrolase n=1 Tax=Alkalibacter rhizosphaerae TaxID=2815577 RepID=A0A975AHR7_9FIRM|nr:MBL fold metallo-hydrolase [Alkalibacter rhizosphaerae]QSX08899.1 MBL fold metallo-hydrolase [Alkalibacter rhizosphaerae]
MKISFYGAAQMVTGSCFLCETEKKRFLVDCGMFQGGKQLDELNYQPFPFNPQDLDFMLLTHAHIDHSGRIPKLVKEGFKGKIYTNTATEELCGIMLEDSGFIQEMEAEWKNKKRVRKGLEEIEPMYTVQDALQALKNFEGVNYGETVVIDEGLKVRLINSGHMLGSAFVEISVLEEEKWNVYLFTGDLGSNNMPILKDPAVLERVDYLVVESTYGNRTHGEKKDNGVDLLEIIKRSARMGGNVVIPSFAVGRTQEVLYDINEYKENGLLGEFENIPVYVDSPLAIKATEIFRRNCKLFDKEATSKIAKGDDPLLFENLHFTLTSDESKAINEDQKSKIIISASGMCEAGRIKHHLKHNLWRKESSVVFVGYQAPGTLGHRIKSGNEKVRVFGEEIAVKSGIYSVEGFSSHGDMDDIVSWIEGNKEIPRKIVLVHGEEDSIYHLQGVLSNRFRIDVLVPAMGDTIELLESNGVIHEEDLVPEIQDDSVEDAIKDLIEVMDLLESKQDVDLASVKEHIAAMKKSLVPK